MIPWRALVALVVLLVVAFAPDRASAAEPGETRCSSADVGLIARLTLAAPDRTPVAVEWMASPALSEPTGGEPVEPALSCWKGGVGDDCRLQDPADAPGGPSPFQLHATPVAVTIDPAALSGPDSLRCPIVSADAGEARPGFARGLDRPPR
jgi:hypothetical protein